VNRFRSFATKRPFLFGLLLIFIYALLGTITYPAHFLFSEDEVGRLYGDALSKFTVFLVFLFILWRFGWMKASRITCLGDVKTWLIVAGILVYKILAELYAFTGDISIRFPDPQLAIANLVFPLSTSLVEETMFRALALVAMILAWGSTKQGQIKAVLLSSVFFGLTHMFNIIVRPFGVVLFQAIVAALPGILYAAIVLARRSLWPAIIIHWLTNAAVNIKLIGTEDYQETVTMWVIFAVSLIPLMAYSAYLIWKLPESYEYEVDEAG
jgi:membrane protease YdiL (CAAX protease family)